MMAQPQTEKNSSNYHDLDRPPAGYIFFQTTDQVQWFSQVFHSKIKLLGLLRFKAFLNLMSRKMERK